MSPSRAKGVNATQSVPFAEVETLFLGRVAFYVLCGLCSGAKIKIDLTAITKNWFVASFTMSFKAIKVPLIRASPGRRQDALIDLQPVLIIDGSRDKSTMVITI